MVNIDKVNSVFQTIKEIGIKELNDKTLSDILCMLTKEELDYFINESFNEFGIDGFIRLNNLRPLIEYKINKYIYDAQRSIMYQQFIEAKNKNMIREFVYELSINDLCELKKILNFKKDKDHMYGFNRLIELIENEIKQKDSMKAKNLNIK